MKKQSPTWAFTIARFAVNTIYCFMILIAGGFILINLLKFLDVQHSALIFGQESSNCVTVVINYARKSQSIMVHPNEPLVSLIPYGSKGLLQVPIRSVLGLSNTIFAVIKLIGGIWFFYLLRQIFQHTRADSPFHSDNARRISKMGWLIIAYSLFSELYDFVIQKLSKEYIEAISPEFFSNLGYSIELYGPWLYGLVLLAMAQVYRKGVELQHENELTV